MVPTKKVFTSVAAVCLFSISLGAEANLMGQDDQGTRQAEVIIPLNRTAEVRETVQPDSELVELQKEKLNLEIEYFKRKLALLDNDELRELSIIKAQMEMEALQNRIRPNAIDDARPESKGVEPTTSKSVQPRQTEIPTASKPAREYRAQERIESIEGQELSTAGGDQSSSGTRSAISMLGDELKQEQNSLLMLLAQLAEKGKEFQEAFRRVELKRSAIESELQIIRQEQTESPNTRRQKIIEELLQKLVSVDEESRTLNSDLSLLNDSQAKLLKSENLIAETINQLENLEVNLQAIREFRKTQEAALKQ